MGAISIFWLALTRGDIEALEVAVREHDATLVQVSSETLPIRAVSALASGAVIAVCSTDREATAALAAGIDEVVRAGEVTRAVLEPAIARAVARAGARGPRGIHAIVGTEQDELFGAIESMLSDQLVASIDHATGESDRLVYTLPTVLDASDDFVQWTALAERDTPRRIMARRLAAPSSRDLKDSVSRIRESLDSIRAALQRAAARTRGPEQAISAARVVEQLIQMLRTHVTNVEIVVESDGPCFCTAPRLTVLTVVSSILAMSIDSIRAARPARGRITVRVFAEEDTVVVEIEDNGREIVTDLRPGKSTPFFREPSSERPGLPGLRDRVRRLGGDIVVATGEHGNNVRVMLPVGEVETLHSDVAPVSTSRKNDKSAG